MKLLCFMLLCLGLSVTGNVAIKLEMSDSETSNNLLLATHYLDRKELYFLGQEEDHEVQEEYQEKVMPKQPDIYDPELYRGR